MTQRDHWERETGMKVDSLKRDVDTLKRDVDSRVDSLRREMDWQFRDRAWRVESLERFRDYIEKLVMYGAMTALCLAFVVFLVVMIAEDRDERQEREQLQERSLSSIKLPPGDQVQPHLFHVTPSPTAPVAQEHLAL